MSKSQSQGQGQGQFHNTSRRNVAASEWKAT